MSSEASSGGDDDSTTAFEYDVNSNETMIEAVLTAVSAVTNVPLLPSETDDSSNDRRESLPPLYNAIDPEALGNLTPDTADNTAEWRLTFSYAGCEVTVTDSETIHVSEHPVG
ncbi:HalOD1 output domain-containing protein [Natronorubrum daqingense]|uniref:Halobacterial output domain-containing protein n=1 Tax=Natronorubrum daqingense TaxID=588898 RepID=A0A1N7AHY3_9EURY|nr:HalOD1 output domain-containing protein [Natronorubrum daqingense]APX97974.1 hypothetical protein BB347_15915 [Natronorubrum daqingense]SIR38685.1 hypothetical protein SAMN05421809_1177 [Natronorubrum daqingense]